MTGAALRYDLSAAERIRQKVERLAGLDRGQLLGVIGGTVESQTRRRIEGEKSGPDGTPWAAWSENYAESRHGGHSLLEGANAGGGLLGSIDHQVVGDAVEVGTNLAYGAVHQFGSGDEPVSVPAHTRLITQVFGRELSMGVWAQVKPYSFLQNIPARPYLGLSGDNEEELLAVVEDWLDQVVLQ